MTLTGDRLTALRERNGWTKTRVSNVIGVPMSTYANYEYGRREPDVETMKKLAKLYNVTVDYLVGNDDAESKRQTVDLAKDPEVLLYNGRKVSAEDMDIIKAILERHED